MAFCILIFKEEENENFARYNFMACEFKDTDKKHGVLEINKENGEITLIKAADYDEKKHFYQRASYKIFTHWKNGDLPDKTIWAS